jgi:putative transposase
VKVRFNEEDLSQVHIWNERTSEYVTVEAVNQRYVEGLNLFQHRQIKVGQKSGP